MSAATGDALIALLDWSWPCIGPRLPPLEALAAIVRPHPPFSITTDQGEVLTGIVVVDRGRVLAFVGTRQRRSPPTSRWQREFYDDDPFWSDDHPR